MSDLHQTLEMIVLMFLLLIPVGGVLLLFTIAHVAGGGLKGPRSS